MAIGTYPAPIREKWGDSTSPVTLGSTVVCLLFDKEAQEVELLLSGTAACNLKLSPRIQVAWLYDATDGSYGDGVTANRNAAEELQDKDTTTALTLNSMQTTDFVYIGLDDPCIGFNVDAGDKNGNTVTLTVKYYTGSAWASTSATDNTADTNRTLFKDGTITWTEPTTEAKTTVNNQELYWYQLSVSGALDSTVTILALQALCRKANSLLAAANVTIFSRNKDKVSGMEFNIASTTPTLNINYLRS